MSDRFAEDYDNGIEQALQCLCEKKIIEWFLLTGHNSKEDKRGFDAIVGFKVNGKGGIFSFQLKRKWGAVVKHKKKYPGVPPIIVPASGSLQEKIDLLMDAFAFWGAYNYDKASLFKDLGKDYAFRYYKYYPPKFYPTELRYYKKS